MGTRSPDTVKDEISTIRAGLDAKLTELERRLPPLVSTAKKVAVGLAGGTGGGAVLFVARKLRARSKKRARTQKAVDSGVLVHVLPRGALPVALALAGIWAAVRLYEARMRSGESGSALKAVRDFRSSRAS